MIDPRFATGALDGVRVLDLSRVLAAPYCAQILGDLGADIIKVERPRTGDDARRFGINALPGAAGERSQDTSFFLAANRNKRSLTLEIATAAGRDIVRALVARSDVLIENFKTGTMARFGLDYATLHALNSRLIYCSVTGYGQDGPYAGRAGYDAVFQAQSGLMAVTGQPEEFPGSEPTKAGPSIVDTFAGMNAAIAILAALRHRDATGLGQWIDIALLDSAIAATTHSGMEYLISGATLPRAGNQGNGGAPANSFRCRDGRIYLSVGTREQYVSFCKAIGMPELADDPGYATSALRFAKRKTLNDTIGAALAKWQVGALVDLLTAVGVPAGSVNDYGQAFADEQVQHRHIKVDMPHPVHGTVALIGSPLRMSETPPVYRLPPPQLGEHTDQILAELVGLDDNAIAQLRRDSII